MKLKLHIDDYVTAIGGVSLLRLQEWACNHLPHWQGILDRDKPIQAGRDAVEVDPSVLDHLPEWYFKYLMDKHSALAREREKFGTITDFKYQTPKDQIARLREAVSSNLKKLEKYYPDHARIAEMKQVLAEVKALKPEDAGTHLERLRDAYLEALSTAEFEERLTLNVIRSFLNNNFFGQTSMLQLTRSNYSLQQHIDQMQSDFIEPIKRDVWLRDWLDKHPEPDAESHKELVEWLRDTGKSPYQQWGNQLKKLRPEDIHPYFAGKLRCSYESDWFAVHNFEEMVFAPLGISAANVNFNWDLTTHQMPVSNWIRLVMFLAPAGLTRFTRLYKDEFESYYSFIYRDGTPRSLFEDNNEMANMEHNESFERLIPKLVQRETFKAKKEVQPHIQIIEFYSDVSLRKTIMNYFHIPRHLLTYFSSNLTKLHLLNRAIRDPFLRLIMDGVDPIETIWQYLQKVVRGKVHPLSAFLAVRERWVIEQLKKKEGNAMTTEDIRKKAGYIYHIAKEGEKIRRKLEQRADQQLQSTDYASSGGKRAAGIAHRLLNAARANDKPQFMDTTIRLYLTVGESVPQSILNVFHEERVDFATWAGAFIAGLLGSETNDNANNADDDQTAVNS